MKKSLSLHFAFLFLMWIGASSVRAQTQGPLSVYSPRALFKTNEELYFQIVNNFSKNLTISSWRLVNALNKKTILKETLATPLIVEPHPCADFKNKGCNSPLTWRLPISLKEGYYYLQLFTTDHQRSNSQFLIIRADIPATKSIAVMFPTFTWQAYNEVGGGSMYSNPTNGNYEASVYRPLWTDEVHTPEITLRFVRLLRSKKISVWPVTSEDLDRNFLSAEQLSIFLFTGHDEYWTDSMRNHFKDFVSGGGRALIYAGNVCWWKANFDGNSLKVKKIESSPTLPGFEGTGLWDSASVGSSSVPIIGQGFQYGGYPLQRKVSADEITQYGLSQEDYQQSGSIKILLPQHPLFAGLNLRQGQRLKSTPDLLTVEIDGVPLSGTRADLNAAGVPADTIVLASAQLYNPRAPQPVVWEGVISEHKIGQGKVLHLGSIGWSDALVGSKELRHIFWNSIDYMQKP